MWNWWSRIKSSVGLSIIRASVGHKATSKVEVERIEGVEVGRGPGHYRRGGRGNLGSSGGFCVSRADHLARCHDAGGQSVVPRGFWGGLVLSADFVCPRRVWLAILANHVETVLVELRQEELALAELMVL